MNQLNDKQLREWILDGQVMLSPSDVCPKQSFYSDYRIERMLQIAHFVQECNKTTLPSSKN